MSKILIVDDEPNIAGMIVHALSPGGHDLETADGGLPAIKRLRATDFDLVITDMMMPDADGFAVIKAARERPNPPDVIVVSGFGTIDAAVRAMKCGAAEYVTKPFDIEKLKDTVANALSTREQGRPDASDETAAKPPAGRESGDFAGMIGRGEPMRKLYRTIEQVARTDSTVMICGESGSGKELVARAIHETSGRAAGPFVAVDCGALSQTLLESELFGHMPGAFTGAVGEKRGLLEAASGGTLLMDEIGEMTPSVQSKLLRSIQEKAVRPVGSTDVRNVDVRILSATNRDLEKLVEEGSFRRELFYRLNVVRVDVPSLVEHGDDVPMLAEHFARKVARRLHRRVPKISDTVLLMLRKSKWPGNVRQLENVIECAITFAEGDEIRPEHLPDDFVESFALAKSVAGRSAPEDAKAGDGGGVTQLGAAIRYLEHQMLSKALDVSGGNKKAAAGMLGIDRATLYRKLKSHGLTQCK